MVTNGSSQGDHRCKLPFGYSPDPAVRDRDQPFRNQRSILGKLAKRAAIAVARKLAVIMPTLLKSGELFTKPLLPKAFHRLRLT